MKNQRKELEHFNIENCYGGNQRWMRDWWMHIGGCAALTACDVLIYCALHRDKEGLYPYDTANITKKEYKKFAMYMKLYLQPRKGGIKDTETFMKGVSLCLEDLEEDNIKLRSMSGNEDYEDAKGRLMDQIDVGMPAAYLLLKHKDKKFDFFEWHWFIINGYEKKDDGFYIKAATYGAAHWLKMDELWDTGFDEKGGIVFFDIV